LWASPGQAAVAKALSLSELVKRSRFAVLATALSQESSWQQIGDSRRIVTTTRTRVEELVTGEKPETSEILVRTLGGRVGKIGQMVEGEAELLIGETALVFTRVAEPGLYAVTAMAQGHYPLVADSRGKVLRASRTLPALVGSDDSAVKRLTGKTLSDALKVIRAERP
jgi:hypothetical protein